MTGAELSSLIGACPPDTLLVIDEAYWEYAHAAPDYADSLAVLRAQTRPWIVLRTFSKAYGLAGLRVGYALTSEDALAEILNRIRDPFNSNCAALEMARLCLADQAHMRQTVERTLRDRARLKAALEERGFAIPDSRANFLFFDAGEPAEALAERLLRHGVIVKPWKEPGFQTRIRVSIGLPEDSRRFLAALDAERRPREAGRP